MKKRRKENKKDKITKAAAVMYFVKIFVSKIGQANFSIVKLGKQFFPQFQFFFLHSFYKERIKYY